MLIRDESGVEESLVSLDGRVGHVIGKEHDGIEFSRECGNWDQLHYARKKLPCNTIMGEIY